MNETDERTQILRREETEWEMMQSLWCVCVWSMLVMGGSRTAIPEDLQRRDRCRSGPPVQRLDGIDLWE
jgi:hypothetical protein